MSRSSSSPSIQSSSQARRLCVFARAPVLGQVKSRLAEGIGEQGALEAHIRLVEHTLTRVREFGLEGQDEHACRRELWIAGNPRDPLVRYWSERFDFQLREQCAGDLGARMRFALRPSVSDGATVLVGSDCPTLDAVYIEAAFEALANADVVLGPTEDGGYGLIGTCRDLPELFAAMPWSTDRVLTETRTRCDRLALRCTLLPMIWDVDNSFDWQRFLRQVPSID